MEIWKVLQIFSTSLPDGLLPPFVSYCRRYCFNAALKKDTAMNARVVEEQVKIIPYSAEHYDHFRQLNEAWITKYFSLEEIDRRLLHDPQTHILAEGGYIFIATYQGEVAGTCALIRQNNLTFELAKMAVAEHARGKGIGHALGAHCIAFAKSVGIRRIELLSNTVLTPAINLYKKLGFAEVQLPETEFRRANIKMVLDLQTLLKASVIIADDLPPGLATNAAALVGTAFGNRLKFLTGPDVTDGAGETHTGLTWLPFTMLKADRATVHAIRQQAAACPSLLIVDVPVQAQMTRVYEDFSQRVASASHDELQYLAVGLYGDRNTVTALTKKISLYK